MLGVREAAAPSVSAVPWIGGRGVQSGLTARRSLSR